jgi:6-phosphogluconolactonase
MSPEPHVRVLGSKQELSTAGAELFVDVGSRAIAQTGRFVVALSGGSTPKGMNQELVANFSSRLDWQKVFFFWSDERHVPPDHPDSNFKMANETLLSKLPVPPDHIFRTPAELQDAGQAASAYEAALQNFFRLPPGSFPRFDLILLGMGPDGHTASLFPGTTALEETQHLVVANWVEKFSTFRITFTYPVLNNAATVAFLVSGSDKAETINKVFKDPAANLPCQKVQPHDGNVIWLLDKEAAEGL